MSARRARTYVRRIALVWLLLSEVCGILCCFTRTATAAASGDAHVVFYPPLDRAQPRPLFVMLHGMCGAPESACSHFSETIASLGWLVCPRAARPCEGGGSTWAYRDREQTIEQAVASVRQRFPGEIDESRGRTLIGFSLGAFVANDLAQRPDGLASYPRVLLIGARVFPSALLLERAGTSRIVLAAGQYDMTYAHMATQALRLSRAGFAARFLDLGRIGHRFPSDFANHLQEALRWLDPPAPSPPLS